MSSIVFLSVPGNETFQRVAAIEGQKILLLLLGHDRAKNMRRMRVAYIGAFGARPCVSLSRCHATYSTRVSRNPLRFVLYNSVVAVRGCSQASAIAPGLAAAGSRIVSVAPIVRTHVSLGCRHREERSDVAIQGHSREGLQRTPVFRWSMSFIPWIASRSLRSGSRDGRAPRLGKIAVETIAADDHANYGPPAFRRPAWSARRIGASPSGKAADFDSAIRRFESSRPSQ